MEELQNENPDMEVSEVDEFDPDFKMKWIDQMEKQMNFSNKWMMEEKIGTKTVEAKEKVK